MFKFFNKKAKSKYPVFRVLRNFHKRKFYFLRNTEWTPLENESILVTDPGTLEILTLSSWGTLIFSGATGEKTIEEYVYFLADHYTGDIPYSLDHIIIFELLELEKKNIISLTDKKQSLPKEFESPGLSGLK